MDADVAQLVREERLLEAARLTSERGNAREASLIYERACDWRSAAAEAMRTGDAGRALQLALDGGDESTAESALALLVRDPTAAEATADRLARRGHHGWAARALEQCGRLIDAARAWERAGEAGHAAALLEQAGDAADAERVLQAALRQNPDDWRVASTLGELLVRFGKWEAAVRVLQRIPVGSPDRHAALAHLAKALQRLGLTHAASGATAELKALGEPMERDSDRLQPAPLPPPCARLFGQYDVVREVASSPSARVLECVEVLRGERVAVKVLVVSEASRGAGRDALARFEREVRAMRSLEHPNVAPLRDFVREAPAIVLAWMEGGTLERMLAETEAIAPARAIEIASSVLSALSAAHRLGILHRDVKPANVLFDGAGGARLADFGVAHLSDVSTTATAGIFGTLAYMSPEQREGRPASPRSDVFAVGVMLREMLTGERSSATESPHLLPSEAHRELDARHDALIARMTAHDAEERPVDASEACAMIAALPWPALVDATRARLDAAIGASAKPSEGAGGAEPGAGLPRSDRLEPQPDGTALDRWTGRRVAPSPLSERSLAQARAFALADHPGLQTVWRIDKATNSIWLEAPNRGELDRPLSPEERARLGDALAALRQAGGVYGRVDARHVAIGSSGVVLRFDAAYDEAPTHPIDS